MNGTGTNRNAEISEVLLVPGTTVARLKWLLKKINNMEPINIIQFEVNFVVPGTWYIQLPF